MVVVGAGVGLAEPDEDGAEGAELPPDGDAADDGAALVPVAPLVECVPEHELKITRRTTVTGASSASPMLRSRRT